jgi:hypothetical protein
MNDQRPAPYVEARSALNGALLTFGLLPLAAEIVCLVIGLTAGQRVGLALWLACAVRRAR